MLGFTPPTLLPFIFYFKQTNMKLLPQIKGESSSVIPEGLANGGAGPPFWKEREDCGAKQPLPGVHKSARVPVRETSCLQGSSLPSLGESWLLKGFLGARVRDL